MKTMNKAVPVIAIALAAILAFSGCKGRSGAGASGRKINFTGYPMDAKDHTIKWSVGSGYLLNTAYTDPKDSPFHAGLMDMLGVTIEWILPLAGTGEQQFNNLLFASGDFPDIMFGGGPSGFMREAERYIDEETFRDLTPYMQQWSPAYWGFIHSNPAYDRAMKTDAGQYYGYGSFREDGGWNDTFLGPVVNKTWLDENGLAMPVTIADWENAMRVFNDRYGAVLSMAWNRVVGNSTGIAGAFGAYSMLDHRLYIDPSNRVQLANIQPQYRDMLAKFNQWWNEGLLDQDFSTLSDGAARSNALNKRMGLSFTSMGQLTIWRNDAEQAGNGAEWVGLGYPRGNDGSLVQVNGGYGIGDGVAVITTNVDTDEKLEVAMRVLDYAYTQDGNLYWNFGKRGVSWDYGSDGKPMYLPLVTEAEGGANAESDKYGGATWAGNCIQATLLIQLRNAPEAVAANDLWFYPNEAITARHTIPNGLILSPDEANRAASLTNAIKTYVDEMTLGFLTGAVNLNTWDAYVQRVNGLGLSELLSIYQAAYDRYYNR